jgi:16S rRNA (guanine966-N2)-methyltransferase
VDFASNGFIYHQIRMRVIGGTFRSRRLIAPRGMVTRPTSDRLRETLFNVLSPRIEDAVFADLYSGSGAVGIEAISRGARMVYFVEKAAPAVSAIRANLAALEVHSGFQILSSNVSVALRQMEEGNPCNLVFLDPPYAASEDYDHTLSSIGKSADRLLTADALVIAEHSRKIGPSEEYGPLRRYRLLQQGDATLSFYTR